MRRNNPFQNQPNLRAFYEKYNEVVSSLSPIQFETLKVELTKAFDEFEERRGL